MRILEKVEQHTELFDGLEVTAVDCVIRKIDGLNPKSYKAKKIDLTSNESVAGLLLV